MIYVVLETRVSNGKMHFSGLNMKLHYVSFTTSSYCNNTKTVITIVMGQLQYLFLSVQSTCVNEINWQIKTIKISLADPSPTRSITQVGPIWILEIFSKPDHYLCKAYFDTQNIFAHPDSWPMEQTRFFIEPGFLTNWNDNGFMIYGSLGLLLLELTSL